MFEKKKIEATFDLQFDSNGSEQLSLNLENMFLLTLLQVP